jgi:hypothetical protein
MKACYLAIGVASAIAFGASPAFADHNSPNEEGWANMPNDIHNTRVDTLESGDNEAFRDFVKYGEGADSVNRFASDETMPPGEQAQKGNADAAKAQAKQMSGTQTQEMSGTQAQTKQMGGTRTATQQMGGTETKAQQMGGTETKTQQMGGVETRTKAQMKNGTGDNSRIKEQRRMRPDSATGTGTRQRNSRQGSGRRGGGKG